MTGTDLLTQAQALHTDPALFVVQSRLYSPNYRGPGRWIVFNPRTRAAFLAVGGARQEVRSGNQLFSGMAHQDVLPPVIELLQVASGDGGLTDNADQSGKLRRAGLLTTDARPACPTYLSRYQLAVYNYPFYDYSDPDWLEKDVARMQRFAQLWSPPALDSDYQGALVPLPSPGSLDSHEAAACGVVTPDALAYILRYAFGAIGTVNFKFGVFHHKTSPSGGARHPTEGVVVVREPMEGIRPGAYHYDAARNALVESPALKPLADGAGAPLEILCRVHVERAMFRYRDIRSWRPVLLDVGHVIETIRLLAGLWNLPTGAAAPAIPGALEGAFLADPVVGAVRFGPADAPGSARAADELSSPPDFGPGVQTSPFMYLTFDDGAVWANVAHPRLSKTPLSLSEFQMLSYCVPSTRGDRPTDADSLAERFPDLTRARLRTLVDQSVLLRSDEAGDAYDQTELWSRYAWYPSLLAHLEARSAVRSSGSRTSGHGVNVLEGTPPADVTRALATRRTCRTFAAAQLSRADFTAVLAAGADRRFAPVRMVAVLHDVEGRPAGALGSVVGQVFRDSGIRLSRNRVREMVIGQYPASAGALTLWLLADADVTAPEGYEATIVQLGELAQRLILAATTRGLGVFCTPAINDDTTFEELGVRAVGPQTIAYVLAVGRAADGGSPSGGAPAGVAA